MKGKLVYTAIVEKEIEKDAHEMWEEKIRNILKGDKK